MGSGLPSVDSLISEVGGPFPDSFRLRPTDSTRRGHYGEKEEEKKYRNRSGSCASASRRSSFSAQTGAEAATRKITDRGTPFFPFHL